MLLAVAFSLANSLVGTRSSAEVELPASFGKGLVFSVANGGTAASGVCVGERPNTWTWSASGGIRLTKSSATADNWSDNPNEDKRLGAWNKAHGWTAQLAGKRLGGKPAYYLFGTGMSKMGTVVVGLYGREWKEGEKGFVQGQTIKGTDVDVSVRPFVWTKAAGFRDLWALAGTDSDLGLDDLNEASAAVSPDGKTAAFLTTKLYVVRL